MDSNNNVVTPTTLNAAGPVVSVMYSSGSSPAVFVPDDDLLPKAIPAPGNQFTFDSATNTWQFNLDTSPLTASGTYTVSVQTGDGSQYALSTCSQTFSRR